MNQRSSKNAPLHELGVAEIADGVRNGRFTAEDVVQACLARIEEREPSIGAWAHLDEAALGHARTPFAPSVPLAGVPFGVKDVIDTAGLPTEMGSALYRGHGARYDAGCVAQMRMAGAIVLGKTVSAEFAGTQPTRTANPHDPAHTPGGSSSGSAAAVADFMVPFAFGTQTGGSVLRPAAFCGVVGFKPTYGFYTISGMKPAAHSFDTIGLIARSVEDVALLHGVMMDDVPSPVLETAPRIGLFRTHLWNTVDTDTEEALERTSARLQASGAQIVEIALPAGFETVTQQRAVINAFERARGLAAEWASDRTLMTPQSAEVVERGFAVSGAAYAAARQAVDAFRTVAASLLADVDVLLTPVTTGEAPKGRDYAGDPRLQELWTMLHLPSLTLPVRRGVSGLPVGIQLVGPRFQDRSFLAAAGWISQRLPPPSEF